jgi:hypothetical protein
MLGSVSEGSGPDRQNSRTQLRWRASIDLAVGSDGPVSSIVESEHGSEVSAREWIEHKLPGARFPAWIPPARRADGVELFGRVARGHVLTDRPLPTWDTDGATEIWHADRSDGRVQWRRCAVPAD